MWNDIKWHEYRNKTFCPKKLFILDLSIQNEKEEFQIVYGYDRQPTINWQNLTKKNSVTVWLNICNVSLCRLVTMNNWSKVWKQGRCHADWTMYDCDYYQTEHRFAFFLHFFYSIFCSNWCYSLFNCQINECALF